MKSLILFQYELRDVLEQVRFMSIQLFVFFLHMVGFPLIISQPWPYWCCFSFFHLFFCLSCLIFVIFTFLKCAKNLIETMGVWRLLLIIKNVFYSEKTFKINKSMHQLIFKRKRESCSRAWAECCASFSPCYRPHSL